jgi:hypothetical protein
MRRWYDEPVFNGAWRADYARAAAKAGLRIEPARSAVRSWRFISLASGKLVGLWFPKRGVLWRPGAGLVPAKAWRQALAIVAKTAPAAVDL